MWVLVDQGTKFLIFAFLLVSVPSQLWNAIEQRSLQRKQRRYLDRVRRELKELHDQAEAGLEASRQARERIDAVLQRAERQLDGTGDRKSA